MTIRFELPLVKADSGHSCVKGRAWMFTESHDPGESSELLTPGDVPWARSKTPEMDTGRSPPPSGQTRTAANDGYGNSATSWRDSPHRTLSGLWGRRLKNSSKIRWVGGTGRSGLPGAKILRASKDILRWSLCAATMIFRGSKRVFRELLSYQRKIVSRLSVGYLVIWGINFRVSRKV